MLTLKRSFKIILFLALEAILSNGGNHFSNFGKRAEEEHCVRLF